MPTCLREGCDKPSSMQCPTCVKKKLPASYFCSQDCFKQAWVSHKAVHRAADIEEAKKNWVMPKWDYTGPLRPAYVSPRVKVPAHIKKPDYADTGIPHSEREDRRSGNKHIRVYTDEEIVRLRKVARLGREILDIGARAIKPGVTTDEIDQIVHQACMERDCYPSPLNYVNFPKSLCTSVNEVICHGIPDARPLEDGDIVNLDISVYHDGMHSDMNETYTVGGSVDDDSKRLIKTTHDALWEAIKAVKPGALYRDMGNIIEKYVKKEGFSVVTTYCGHGVGELFHTGPNIPHYAKNKAAGKMQVGHVFTIEPMINAGSYRDRTWDFDDWTAVTVDGKRSAQFEHMMVVTEDGCEVLSARLPDSVPLWWEK